MARQKPFSMATSTETVGVVTSMNGSRDDLEQTMCPQFAKRIGVEQQDFERTKAAGLSDFEMRFR